MGTTYRAHSKIVVIVSAAATILGAAASAAVASPTSAALKTDTQIKQRLTTQASQGACTVIVKIKGDLTPMRQACLAALDADVTRHLSFIHSVALTLPTRNLGKLAALPFVTHLSYDGAVRKCDGFTDASSGAAAARQRYGLTGQGVTVAVIDSGIQCSHWDLKDPDGNWRTLAYPDFTSQTQTSVDYCGHASHVAGIIAGDGVASTGAHCTHTYYGVAPEANLVSVRVLDQSGASTVSTVLAGLQWVISNKKTYNIRVVNMSLGHPVGESYRTDPLCQAVEAVWKAGIVVVCAAGNDGRASSVSTAGAPNEGWGTAYGSIQSPANDPSVITVGATKSMDGIRADDRIATYSSRGPSRLDRILKPDIIAPGNKVISLDVDQSVLNAAFAATNLVPYSAYTTVRASGPAGTLGASNRCAPGYSNAYFVLSGTSMAAPVVSGAAALMLEEDPTLTPDTIKARLMATADKWTDPTGIADPFTYGAGYLDIPAALASTITAAQPALSPPLTMNASRNVSIDKNNWGNGPGAWGSSVWGSKAISGVSSIYGSKAISGVSTVLSSKAISGSSVWGDTSVFSTSSAAVDLTGIAAFGE